MKGVQLTKLVQELGLHNLTPEIDLSEILIKTAEINRPALQLTGYLEPRHCFQVKHPLLRCNRNSFL